MKSGENVLLIGDSLAVGLAGRLGALVSEAGGTFSGQGVNSTTVHDWAPRMGSLGSPTVLLVSLGTNDMRGGRSDFSGDVASIVDAGKSAGARVYWISPPKMPFSEGSIRSELASTLASRGVPLFHSETADYARAADGIHMPPSGYSAWGSDIFAWLDAQGSSLSNFLTYAALAALAYLLWE